MRIFVAMSEKVPSQASSKDDLDQLSALEESMARFGMDELDTEHGVILKDWSAQDFANIYVRFRPHLISHARKFLREETQAEEVVQDAFLYLMTALPELDSELGVLRFLKWKTKMLCLDIIRSSQAGLNGNLVPLPEEIADEARPLDSLERADDAAIIRLALARLSERQREVLIATTLEGRPYAEVALKMGMSDNAFRQLLLRARRAFKKELVGEAETNGKTAAQILTLAARKASTSLTFGATAVLVAIGLILTPVLGGPTQSGDMEALSSRNPNPLIFPEVDERKNNHVDHAAVVDGEANFESSENLNEFGSYMNSSSDSTTSAQDATGEFSSFPSVDAEKESQAVDASIAAMESHMGPALVAQLSSMTVEGSSVDTVEGITLVEIQTSEQLEAAIAMRFEPSVSVMYSGLTLKSQGYDFALVPRRTVVVRDEILGEGLPREVVILLTDFVVGDLTGSFGDKTLGQSVVGSNGVLLELSLGPSDEVLGLSLRFSNRT